MKNISTKINKNMNILRGIEIPLVLIGHSIFKDLINIKHIENANFLAWIYDFIYTFHMPLFFFISGFFTKKVFNIDNLKDYLRLVKEKTLRLFLPYILFSCFGLIIKLILNKYVKNPINIHTVFIDMLTNPWNNTIKLLWFIYTLYLIFLLMPLLNKVNNKLKIAILIILWCIPTSYGTLFNINGVIRYSLFFILGYEFYKYYDYYLKNRISKLIPLTLFLILILINIKPVESKYLVNIFELICSLLAICSLTDFVHIIDLDKNFSKVFNSLGNYSFDIYLLHYFFQMPIRLISDILNYNTGFEFYIVFVVALFMGLLSGLFSKYIVRKINILSFLAFGKIYNSKAR